MYDTGAVRLRHRQFGVCARRDRRAGGGARRPRSSARFLRNGQADSERRFGVDRSGTAAHAGGGGPS